MGGVFAGGSEITDGVGVDVRYLGTSAMLVLRLQLRERYVPWYCTEYLPYTTLRYVPFLCTS